MNYRLPFLTIFGTALLSLSGCSAVADDAAEASTTGSAAQDPVLPGPLPPAPTTEQHEWLQQLVGEWTVTTEATMAPGAEPMRMESTESCRSIGGLWIVGEGSAVWDGKPFQSILTLGYDPRKARFVGTWIDTAQTQMWVYSGTLDEQRRTLTLEAEGPLFEDPTKTANYRDVIELVGPDHRVLTSSVQADNGSWTTFMRGDFRRKGK